MRASRMNITTLREDPADAEIASHSLLIRAGYLYKSGSGLYVYGPLLQRVIDKIATIINEEISATGALHITMPILQEQSLWERSGRWDAYQQSRTMLTVTDRGGQTFGLAPTAEEVVTDFAAHRIGSYKQLPVCFYQQHTKFRDEIRPRFGLMRVKEFIMMDAYSFHVDDACLDATYQEMHRAYERIFARCGLQAFAVEADAGAIGGSGSHEFMIAADVGEDTILYNSESGYAANVERAEGRIPEPIAWSWSEEWQSVETPDAGSIEDVVAHLNGHGYAGIDASRLLKTVLFVATTRTGEHRVAACVRGDRSVNDVKLVNALGRVLADEVLELRPMQEAEVRAATGARPGFAGPLSNLQVDCVLADATVESVGPLVAGANADDRHVVAFTFADERAAQPVFADIVTVLAGDGDPRGAGDLQERRGIEAGHIFKLGTKYSVPMGATFTAQDSSQQPMVMGCYGIGTSRLAAAAVEQYHDEAGMAWPMGIAPYHCVVFAAKGNDAEAATCAQEIYDALRERGVEVILDDRALGTGVKFKDWELIGIPLRVVVGRGLADGLIECKPRQGEREDIARDAVVDWVLERCAL